MKCYTCNDTFRTHEDFRDHLPCEESKRVHPVFKNTGTRTDADMIHDGTELIEELEAAFLEQRAYIKQLEEAIALCESDGGCRATKAVKK